jgi:hypothetical protein
VNPKRTRSVTAIIVGVSLLVGVGAASAAAPKEARMPGTYTTAYDWYDNNPPGSAEVSHPVVHRNAGGSGTYADPITVAVNYGSGRQLQFKAGTRFYVPNVRAYLIVEDTLGDTAHGRVHLDMWAGGRTSSRDSAERCMSHVTGNVLVIKNPAKNYVVVKGPLSYRNGCRRLYGNTAHRVHG